jgi:hypothetical protein
MSFFPVATLHASFRQQKTTNSTKAYQANSRIFDISPFSLRHVNIAIRHKPVFISIN